MSSKAKTLQDNIWRFELRGVNSYLIKDDDLTLIDAGTPWDTGRLREGIENVGFNVDEIDRVLLTHYDLDHVGTLAKLNFDASFHMAEPDASFLEGHKKPPLRNHKGLLQRTTRFLLERPNKPITRVEGGDEVGGFTAYSAPGHTPGHVVYIHDDLKAAFLGDLVRGDEGDLKASPWVVTYDTRRNRRSIRNLAKSVPEFETAAMGHGDPLTENGLDALRRLAQTA